MVKKDWELRKKEKDSIIYYNKKLGGTLHISKQEKISKTTPLWVVQTANLFLNKGFDTKGQALVFANKYMRKN